MQNARLQKQHRNLLSSLLMSLDFLRANFADILYFERFDDILIAELEENYYAHIRQPRCRNGG